MPLALALIVFGMLWRLAAPGSSEFGNFSPIMAMVFCIAVYFRRGWLWLAPFAALLGSDVFLGPRYYADGYAFTLGESLPRLCCFAAVLGLGAWVARHKSWSGLLGGALGGAVLFYLVTNTGAWAGDTYYAKTAAGWWQAMTRGHLEYRSTLSFFRNTLVSDLLFTGVFALAMETAALRRGEPSLLRRRLEA